MAASSVSARAAVRALALLLVVVAAFLLWPYRTPVIFALVVGYLAHPLYVRLHERLRRGWIAGLVVLTIVGVALVAPFLLLAALFAREAAQVLTAAQAAGGPAQLLADALQRVGVPPAQAEALRATLAQRAAGLVESYAIPGAIAAIEAFFGLIIFFILLYFVLVDGKRFLRWLARLSPLDGDLHERLLSKAGERTKAVVWGSLLMAAAQGVLAAIGWWVLGLPAPVFWGAIMVLVAIIPVLGPFVVLLPAAAWAFATGNVVAGVGLLVLNFLMVGVVDDVLRPIVVGRWARVHPAIVLLGILGGIPVFGLGGLVVGPVLLSLVPAALEAWLAPAADEPQGQGLG